MASVRYGLPEAGEIKMTNIMEEITAAYIHGRREKILFLTGLFLLVVMVSLYTVTSGVYDISLEDIIAAISQNTTSTHWVVLVNIRLPRTIAAIVSGWGLALAGLSFQSLLKNPLGAPTTLGISHGAAFGAALSIIVLGLETVSVSIFAFLGGMGATAVILLLSVFRRLSSEAIVLAGVALSSLFLSATILVQYMASETELAMAVLWTFGDVARSSWSEIYVLTGVVFLGTVFLLMMRWNLNILSSGDETAKGLGLHVERIRIIGMVTATLMAALATAFHGVIAFVGLIAPHIARRLVGDDHSFLIPVSAVIGSLLLLSADAIGRLLIGSGALPVGVITSFLGAPMFIYLLVKGYD